MWQMIVPQNSQVEPVEVVRKLPSMKLSSMGLPFEIEWIIEEGLPDNEGEEMFEIKTEGTMEGRNERPLGT